MSSGILIDMSFVSSVIVSGRFVAFIGDWEFLKDCKWKHLTTYTRLLMQILSSKT